MAVCAGAGGNIGEDKGDAEGKVEARVGGGVCEGEGGEKRMGDVHFPGQAF